MPGCAESGFELIDDKLYTFEPTTGAQRRLQLYGEYSHFLRWRPVSEILAMTWLLFLTCLEVFAERMGPVITFFVLGLCIALAVVFVRLAREQRHRLKALILALPALWLLIGLWGGIFRYPDLSTDQPDRDPPRLASLNATQQSVMKDVLEVLAYSPDSIWQAEACQALEEWWIDGALYRASI